MEWSQKEVLAFAEDRFGKNTQLGIAVRSNKEMSELLSALSNGVTSQREIAMECADIVIFMMQIAEQAGFPLFDLVDEKMNINIDRTWRLLPDGSHQHVD